VTSRLEHPFCLSAFGSIHDFAFGSPLIVCSGTQPNRSVVIFEELGYEALHIYLELLCGSPGQWFQGLGLERTHALGSNVRTLSGHEGGVLTYKCN
jgi:hypothetical protein